MSIASDFKKFALRGNMVDLVIGFTVGAAFTTIVKSFVSDILMPPMGLMTGNSDFSDKFLVLKDGVTDTSPYLTLAEAQSAGAVTLNYGLFINNVLSFLLVAIAVFLLIRVANKIEDRMQQDVESNDPNQEEVPNKKCPYCRSTIDIKALRCPACTSHLEPN